MRLGEQQTPRTPADLQFFLNANDVLATMISDLGDTPTVPAAAAALLAEMRRAMDEIS